MNKISAFVACSCIYLSACETLPDTDTTVRLEATSTVSASATSYLPGQGITVSWSGLPGNNLDWVDFAPAGSPLTTVTLRSYAGGRTVGEAAFQGTSIAGSYVARAFLDDTFTLLAESAPFVVGTCTGASLTAPTSAFTLGLGQPLALSATANCTAGVVPEFNFWTKQSGDANWNQIATGGYSTSSTGSFTAPTAGTWCTEVAVREQGSTVSSRARSASVCGSVGVAPQPALVTRTVPVIPPRIVTGGLAPAVVSGGEVLAVPLVASPGDELRDVRLRITDSPGSFTIVEVVSATDGSQVLTPLAASATNPGNGVEHTIEFAPFVTFARDTNYYVTIRHVDQMGVSQVWRLATDTLPAH